MKNAKKWLELKAQQNDRGPVHVYTYDWLHKLVNASAEVSDSQCDIIAGLVSQAMAGVVPDAGDLQKSRSELIQIATLINTCRA